MDLVLKNNFVDATFRHPFTMIIAGPSGSGKTTFVKQLLEERKNHINTTIDYVYIIIGTNLKQNPILEELYKNLVKDKLYVKIWELNKMFPNKKDLKENFQSYFDNIISKHYEKGEKGCIILDDLMKESGESGILTTIFSRESTHSNISLIFLTQNLFHQGIKNSNVTTYRNTKYLILFYSKADRRVLSYVAQKIGVRNSDKLRDMLDQILEKQRYVVCDFHIESDKKLSFRTNIFAKNKLFYPIRKKDVAYQEILIPTFKI